MDDRRLRVCHLQKQASSPLNIWRAVQSVQSPCSVIVSPSSRPPAAASNQKSHPPETSPSRASARQRGSSSVRPLLFYALFCCCLSQFIVRLRVSARSLFVSSPFPSRRSHLRRFGQSSTSTERGACNHCNTASHGVVSSSPFLRAFVAGPVAEPIYTATPTHHTLPTRLGATFRSFWHAMTSYDRRKSISLLATSLPPRTLRD